MLLIFFSFAIAIFFGTYSAYYFYVKKCATKRWNVKVDELFEPEISILIPTHNEEKDIESKLQNIKNVSYPLEKIEVIVVDDASSDDTAKKVRDFIQRNPEMNLSLVLQNSRVGKSAALNKALTLSTKPIVVVSDADVLWPSNILRKALPFLADPNVGAITGRGVNINSAESWVTRNEEIYIQLTNLIRLGESKVHSTIRFEGGFCAYKREAFKTFDCKTGADDSGTALEVVNNGYRAIMIPEAVFYTYFPCTFRAKFKIKVRRANQLIGLWFQCLRLLFKRRLSLPKRIVIPEIFLFILNPMVLLVLVATSMSILVINPFSLISSVIILLLIGSIVFARRIFIEIIIDNIILLCALVNFIFKRRYVTWD
jgi:cellulose synthase/poly-beta-1,6-N-acetylglucosamine synthase-like glycosyltransferase